MNIRVEDAIGKIIELQNDEVSYRITQFNLGKEGEIDNSDKIKEIIESNDLIAELNSDYNYNLRNAFMGLVKSGFLSKQDLEGILQSDKPLGELFALVYGRAFEGNLMQVLYNWESRGSRDPDPLDRSIRNLYLPLYRVAFRFKFGYGPVTHMRAIKPQKTLPIDPQAKAKVPDRVQSVWLSTYPPIDLSIHQFPEEGSFGHMTCDGAGLHRRSFELYPNENLLIPNFDARFLQGPIDYILYSLEIGSFGSKAKYVDRCLNLLYQMLTQTDLPQEERMLNLPPTK